MRQTAASDIVQLVVFRLNHGRYALPLSTADRVVRAVQVTSLPNAPPVVLGAINVHGEVLPVLNIRRRFRLPDRAISANDWFLLARAGGRKVVLVIDDAEGVITCPATEVLPIHHIVADLEYLSGVVKLPDGLVLIHDLERFLSETEARALNDAINDTSGQ
jgi:purine-binding chemotaxis protein CheW